MINQDFTSLKFRGIKKFRQTTNFNGVFWNPRYESIHISSSDFNLNFKSCLIKIISALLTVAVVWFIMFMIFIIF